MKFFPLKKVDSTYAKVISLLSLMSLGLLVLVVSLYYYMKVQEREIYESSNKVYKNEITALLKLNTEPIGMNLSILLNQKMLNGLILRLQIF